MPTLDLFQPSDERTMLRLLESQRAAIAMRDTFATAMRYADGVMVDDIERELLDRYPETQRGNSTPQEIRAQTIPIAQRFLDEAATLYTGSSTRELVDDEGNVADEPTQSLARLIEDADYLAAMHSLERLLVLTRSAGAWFQPRGGRVRLNIFGAHEVSPIEPVEKTWFDAADQDDYQGFSVSLRPSDVGTDAGEYVYAERAQTVFYSGQDHDRPRGQLDIHANPFRWPQSYDTDDLRGATAELPLQLFTAWHYQRPFKGILPDVDVPIVDLNREVNVQWSMLLDTLGHQGWTQFVATLNEPNHPPHAVQMGPRNVMALGVGEALVGIDSATNYTGLVDVLQRFVQLVAQSKNLSPNDFALTGAAPASGFAKVIDALPKLTARRKLAQRMARQEERVAWPRLAVLGRHLGYFSQSIDQLAALNLRVRFADIEIPQSVDERTKQAEFDIKHGLTTPARILADREGISVEEAQARIEENKATAPEPAPQGQAAPQAPAQRRAGLLGQLIGRRSAAEGDDA